MVVKYKTEREIKCLGRVDTIHHLAGYHDVILPVRFSEHVSVSFEGRFTYNRYLL